MPTPWPARPSQFASPATGSDDQTLTAAPVGGLVSGTTYAVIVPDAADPNVIQPGQHRHAHSTPSR